MSMIIFFVGQNQKNRSLSEILDIKKLMNVDKAIESANGLPNECYTSKQYLEYERNKIFCDKWTVIGVGSSIPKAGDAMPYNLLGIPLLIIRGIPSRLYGLASPAEGIELPTPITVHLPQKILFLSYSKYCLLV